MALCELVYEEGACVDYLVVDANAQYAIHTGLPQAEVIGRRGSTLFGSAEAPYLRECSAAVAGRVAGSLRHVFGPRSRRHFSLLVIPMGANSFGMVLSDIALRKSQEEALETGRLAQRALLDNQPHLTWLKDVEGRFLAVNKVFAEACGLSSPEALVGKTDLDVWPRELAEAYRADDAAVMAAGAPESGGGANRQRRRHPLVRDLQVAGVCARRQHRGHHRRRPGRHRAQAGGTEGAPRRGGTPQAGAVRVAGAEAGEPGRAGGRHRARLQQPADGDPRQRRSRLAELSPSHPARGPSRRDRVRQPARRRAVPADAGLLGQGPLRHPADLVERAGVRDGAAPVRVDQQEGRR